MSKLKQTREEIANNLPEVAIKYWLQSKSPSGMIYLFQIESNSIAAINRAKKRLAGQVTAEGYDSKRDGKILIVRKTFPDTRSFRKFKKSCELDMTVAL